MCDLSTIKQQPCVAVFPGRHGYPVPQGDTHCLSLPVCASHVVLDYNSCAYYLHSTALSILASNEKLDQCIHLQAESQQTSKDETHDSIDKVV